MSVITDVTVLIIIASAIIRLFMGYISERANVVSATGIAASRIDVVNFVSLLKMIAVIINITGIAIIFNRAIKVPCQKYLSISIFWAMNRPIAIRIIGDALLESICIAVFTGCGIFIPVIRKIIPSVIAMMSGFVAIFFAILARFACLFFEYSKMNSPRVNAMIT